MPNRYLVGKLFRNWNLLRATIPLGVLVTLTRRLKLWIEQSKKGVTVWLWPILPALNWWSQNSPEKNVDWDLVSEECAWWKPSEFDDVWWNSWCSLPYILYRYIGSHLSRAFVLTGVRLCDGCSGYFHVDVDGSEILPSRKPGKQIFTKLNYRLWDRNFWSSNSMLKYHSCIFHFP